MFDHPGWKTGKKNLVREIRAAPRIAGRGGAVRLCTGGGTELALVCFFSPPTSGNKEHVRTQKVASGEVMKCVGSMMSEWPHRVLTVVGGDANTRIGRRGDGTEAVEDVRGRRAASITS